MEQSESKIDLDLTGNQILHDLILKLTDDTLRIYLKGNCQNKNLDNLYEKLTDVYQIIVLSEAERRRIEHD